MYKQITLITLTAILIIGCQAGPSVLDQAATMVAQTVTAAPPTNTPLPTSTPLPTNTPTPLPTTTPDTGATATAQASSVLSELSVVVGDEIPYEEGYLAWQQTEPITLNMSGPKDIIQGIDDSLSANDFILKSDVTWSVSGIVVCGAVFRSESNIQRGKQYQFSFLRLSGLPAYFIDVYEFGGFKNTITDAKFSKDLDVDNGATNQFVLVAQDEKFTIYFNGKRQGRFFDYSKQSYQGYFAFLASQDSGTGSCKFENSWVWVLK